MKLKINNNFFWITENTIFDNEVEAIKHLKDCIKNNKPSILQMFTIKGEDIELKQIGWEQIAKQVIKNEN